MHLKSLTLKGFKSFAQATVFAFEPGVTCIVGPNGSGKSNVVDALAWVMGEQGAKTLRGGSMADVIFAGTATRGPLGRAEVELVIDNADGALPIQYTDVSITRTLFRTGSSEYAINGTPCRLLDVQELLSDSGLGREMHVIVGQGRLDEVLRATPDERRGFVEEAAGVLKHRRRKERTLRKLDAMQANLTRLTDLTAEVGRQLKPLGAQAATAREAQRIQQAVREAHTRLAAVETTEARAALDRIAAVLHDLGIERQLARDRVEQLRRLVAELEERETGADLDVARRAVLELEGVRQRFASLAQLAATRLALLADEPDAPGLPLDAESPESAASASRELETALADARRQQVDAERRLTDARQALADLDARLAEQSARIAQADRRIAGLAAAAAGAASRLAAAQAERDRRATAASAAAERVDAARQVLADQPAPQRDAQLPDRVAAAERASVAAAEAAERARDAASAAERRVAELAARAEALRSALGAGDATAALVAAGTAGLRGRVAEAITVDGGWQAAIAAALGPLAEAALADDHATARHVLSTVGDRAVALVPAEADEPVDPDAPADVTAVRALDVVHGPRGVLALLAPVLLVETLDDAERVWAAVSGRATRVVVVTRSGALVSASALRTPGTGRSGLELTAELHATDGRLADARAALAAATADRAAADAAAEAARGERAASAAALAGQQQRERQAERTASALTARVAAAEDEARRSRTQAQESNARLAAAAADAERADAELAAARAEPRPELHSDERGPAAQKAESARDAVVIARLGAEAAAAALEAERRRQRESAERRRLAEAAAIAAARRRAERDRQRAAALAVQAALPDVQASVERSHDEARARLADLERRRAEAAGARQRTREASAGAIAALAALDERARGLDLQAYELRLTLGTRLERAASELGLDEQALAAELLPEGFDRAQEERRLRAEERRLAALGRVNPLALEEFEALTQRHEFLTAQLADLERARADLLRIVDELDVRVARIFEAAFEDTRDAFARIFPTLFPGGSGYLSLTDPANPALSGIEVAVRPAGKRIDRLSLLSGGERSLAAVAFLMAIFQARPSPFYILDEVEAALDDANLGRLLAVVEQLRGASQLILITHQKRTMQIADALYGVSMRQDGVSAVVGQRMAERQAG